MSHEQHLFKTGTRPVCAGTVKALLEFIPRIDADQQILSDFLIYLGKNANLHNM